MTIIIGPVASAAELDDELAHHREYLPPVICEELTKVRSFIAVCEGLGVEVRVTAGLEFNP